MVAGEVFEADIPLPNVANLQSRPGCAEREAGDLPRLVAGVLGLAPDVAIVGESGTGRRSSNFTVTPGKERSLCS